MKPDSQKTTGEQTSDWFHGKADNAASTFQPQGNKSTTQKVGDAVSGGHNHNAGERSFLDKTKDALGFGNHGHTTKHDF
ncbi:hypothetical protein FRC17_008881 [Serendipita sp. 399]|nr:hypothetical protein FRC17_008881 [Serendipita sp. 399]